MRARTWFLLILLGGFVGEVFGFNIGYGNGWIDAEGQYRPERDSLLVLWNNHGRNLSAERDSIVTEEAIRMGMPVNISLALSHAENFTGDSMALSSGGAVGLVQVIPSYWDKSFYLECGTESLYNRRRNVCVGLHILQVYYKQWGSWETAYLAYLGALDEPESERATVYLQRIKKNLIRLARSE